jgi:type II secretory pathway component PulF
MFRFMHYTVTTAKAHPLLFIAGSMAVVGWLAWSINNLTGPLRKLLDNVFPWSIVRQFKGATFLVTLSCLFRNSVTLPNALQQIATWAPRYDKSHLDAMSSRAAEGMASTRVLDTGMLPADAIDRLEVYERVGKFDVIMREVGNANIDRTIEDVDKATVRVAGFLRILFFLLIGAILSDYFGLYDVMQSQVNY